MCPDVAAMISISIAYSFGGVIGFSEDTRVRLSASLVWAFRCVKPLSVMWRIRGWDFRKVAGDEAR